MVYGQSQFYRDDFNQWHRITVGILKYIGELFFSKVGTNCVASKTSGLLIQTNVPVMDLSKQLFKEMLGSYLQTTFSQVLPEILKESLQKRLPLLRITLPMSR